MTTETNRWRGVVGLALAASATALVADRPGLLLVAVLGVAFAAYPRLARTPDPDVRVERRLSDANPRPGDEVTVTVTVTNEGGVLPDVRVVDGVPALLAVTGGSPRTGTVLWPGRSVSFTYRVTAKHGRHSFEPTTVVARDLSGAHEVETSVAVDTEIDCTTADADGPLRDQTLDDVGSVVADRGASGVEFSRTREYRPGDAMSRIDWNRYARTGELTTVEYRSDEAATVVLLVDARPSAYRAAGDGPHAVAHGVSAAEQLLGSLHRNRNLVGLAAVGRESCWLAPGAGRDHRVEARHLLATHPAFTSTPPDDVDERRDRERVDLDAQIEQLRGRLPDGAQVLLLSPLLDDDVVDAARHLDAHGHRVSAVSVDVTGDDSVGQRLAAVERRNRVSRLRSAGLPVVEWQTDTPLVAALLDRPQEVESA
ncbi:DUF58 domain-containing protein [Halomicrococcus sp. SG-WS-1]|uniref:DUF58 domain-containing protein n=1 Tax=Halomicrococcus sp. SG-WS-1 TaxID=3439057 RepID=UPI003F791053